MHTPVPRSEIVALNISLNNTLICFIVAVVHIIFLSLLTVTKQHLHSSSIFSTKCSYSDKAENTVILTHHHLIQQWSCRATHRGKHHDWSPLLSFKSTAS